MQARIKHDLWDGDGSDTPRHIVARRDDKGEVVKQGGYWAYTVEINGRDIGCTSDEVEILPEDIP
jgi:hypothetical protein